VISSLCLTCDFFVSYRTSEEQRVTSLAWQIKSYKLNHYFVRKGVGTDSTEILPVYLLLVLKSNGVSSVLDFREHTVNTYLKLMTQTLRY
jgi:hypothetical protein